MKKSFIYLLFVLLFILAACSSNNSSAEKTDGSGKEMVTYASENGSVEVPADPQRVVVLSSFAGNVLALDVPLVGVDSWSKDNPRYDLENVEQVSEDNLEKIIELNPDLIIGLSTTKNIDKLKEIAPTVTYTYGELDYLEQHIEIGRLLNKEEEARNWVETFKKRAAQLGEEIKAEIGEDTTVSVIESFEKELYVFGDNWGRGTEILYQAMGLKMPEKVQKEALETGYKSLSIEVLPEYTGDYLVISKREDSNPSFMETETYRNIPAVQKGQVFEANAEVFYFNDPITLDYQLNFFQEHFLEK